jgi:hypothetical protein
MTDKVVRMPEGYNGTGKVLRHPGKATTAAPPRKAHLSQNARHALQLLTIDPRGLAEPLLLTYGFSHKMLAGLVRSGLATAQRQTVRVSGQPVEVTRVRITEAGTQALEADQALGLESRDG